MSSEVIEKNKNSSDVLMKVNNIRQAKGKNKSKILSVCTIAAIGLGFIHVPVPALFPAAALFTGVALATTIDEMTESLKNCIKTCAIKSKLKRVAKKVNAICGTNLKFICNYKSRTAGFVLCDESGKIPITSILTSETMAFYLPQDVCKTFNEILTQELVTMNSRRGKGAEAKTNIERKCANLPKIGLDNITDAFDVVGGVLSNRELIGIATGTELSYYEYQKFMEEHKDETLWVFSSHLSSYLNNMTEMATNEKEHVLMQFESHFRKFGAEGNSEYQKLWNQLREEEQLNRTL